MRSLNAQVMVNSLLNNLCRLVFILGLLAFQSCTIFKDIIGALRTECTERRSWVIGSYHIQEYYCIGFSGPPWYPVDLYKDNQKIANKLIKTDSCTVLFKKENEVHLRFNLCDKTVNTY